MTKDGIHLNTSKNVERGRTEATNAERSIQSHHVSGPFSNGAQSRDASMTRGRTVLSTPGSRAASTHPPGIPEGVVSNDAPVLDTGLQRRTSNKHHRQTSVINGIQHSRNPSFNSPLSPESLHNATLRNARARRMETLPATPREAFFPSGHTLTSSIDSALGSSTYKSPPVEDRKHAAPASTFSTSNHALEYLFDAFIHKAEEKTDECISCLASCDDPIGQTCARGVDPIFDQLLYGLVDVAKEQPRLLVDRLIKWRQSKSDSASQFKKQIKSSRSIQRPSPSNNSGENGQINASAIDTTMAADIDMYLVMDRQSSIAQYFLCRCLAQIFASFTMTQITSALVSKLHEAVFEQLLHFDILRNPSDIIRAANWALLGEVLGEMSSVDFEQVTSRYLAALAGWQKEATTSRTGVVHELESKIVLSLSSMQHVKLAAQNRSPSCFNYLRALADLFADSHGARTKQAYCQIFETYMLQLNASQESFSMPGFQDFVSTINPRLDQMLTKARHWNSAIGPSILLLSACSPEVLHSQFNSQIRALAYKTKEQEYRKQAMRCVCWLTWAYLSRSQESVQEKTARIDEVVKMVFPSIKRPLLSPDDGFYEAAERFCLTVHAYRPETYLRSVMLPLLGQDHVSVMKDVQLNQIDLEKLIIALRAFVSIASSHDNHTALPVFGLVPYNHTGSKSDVASSSESSTNHSIANVHNLAMSLKEILPKVLIAADTARHEVSLPEKNIVTSPKTPIVEAFAMNRESTHISDAAPRLYHDLAMASMQALLHVDISVPSVAPLVKVLGNNLQKESLLLREAAKTLLKALTTNESAQLVLLTYARALFESSCRTLNGEMLSREVDICESLALYLEMLSTWSAQLEERIQLSCSDPLLEASQPLQTETATILSLIDEVEAYGVYFLCAQPAVIRRYAIRLLERVIELDQILEHSSDTRVVVTITNNSDRILDFAAHNLSIVERSLLEKERVQKRAQNVLLRISSSDSSFDSSLWHKALPNVVKQIFDACPRTVATARGLVCTRLASMQHKVQHIADNVHLWFDANSEGLLHEWRQYLVFACVTFTTSATSSKIQSDITHNRNLSEKSSHREKLTSARALISTLIPYLDSGCESLRSSAVVALGSINPKLCQTLLTSMQYAIIMCNEDVQSRSNVHQRTPSSPTRSQAADRMRIEIAHVYKLAASFLQDDDNMQPDILKMFLSYTKDLRLYLSNNDTQPEWKMSKLRLHYCGLIEELHHNIKRLPSTKETISFDARRSAFTLMEDWSVPQGDNATRHPTDTSHLAKDRSNLRVAAISAMATLCAGPVSVLTEAKTILQFNIPRIEAWLDGIFAAREARIHELGQKALRNLITYNTHTTIFTDYAVSACYGSKGHAAQISCFTVLVDIIMQSPQPHISVSKIMATIMFTLGHDDRKVRIKSGRLLRAIDARNDESLNLQHFDISISDKTRAVYKAAQFEYSRHLAQAHPDLAFHIFSEFCLQFRIADIDIQRSMVATILPWLQMLELQVLPASNSPTDLSYMLLVNMIEITIKCGKYLHNEVQALWQTLANGASAGNVQLILDFIVELCLDRRDQNFVECAKQIVVYLSTTPAGAGISAFFLMRLAPKNMPNEKRSVGVLRHIQNLPYVADMEKVLPPGLRQTGLSSGQLALVFLVDLLIPPIDLNVHDIAKLVHVVFILWDHQTTTVQEQAREMLVHIIHVFVIARIPISLNSDFLDQIETLVDAIRDSSPILSWSYGDYTMKSAFDDEVLRAPTGMQYLAKNITSLLSIADSTFPETWARQALSWASVCSVRHLACRSFQVSRCIPVRLDYSLLSDMLACLSNTVSNREADYQTFSLEILVTIRHITAGQPSEIVTRYPQVFWMAMACFSTVHEREYFEALRLLDVLLQRLDFSNPSIISSLLRAKPAQWQGSFRGIERSLHRGMTSCNCSQLTLHILQQMAMLNDNDLLGHNYLPFVAIAQMPYFMLSAKDEIFDGTEILEARQLATSAMKRGQNHIADVLQKVARKNYNKQMDLLHDLVAAIVDTITPEHVQELLLSTVNLLNNPLEDDQVRYLQVLQALIARLSGLCDKLSCSQQDLIIPLLGLLQTKHYKEAIAIIDSLTSTFKIQALSVESRDRIHEPSGWTVANASLSAGLTSSNVHHVFFSMPEPAAFAPSATNTPDLGDYEQIDTESYFPSQMPAPSTGTFEADTTMNIGDIVSSLDDLDEFFEENETPTIPMAEPDDKEGFDFSNYRQPVLTPTINADATTAMKRMTTIRAPELNSSFSSVDDLEGPGPSMPTSGRRSPSVPALMNVMTRPDLLHTRSATSPSNNLPTLQTFLTSPLPLPPMPTISTSEPLTGKSSFEDVLSDSETSPFPTLGPTITLVDRVPTPTTSAESMGFMRRGMRRLTGGRSESAKEKSRLRAPSVGNITHTTLQGEQSPKMPRIPDQFLHKEPTTDEP